MIGKKLIIVIFLGLCFIEITAQDKFLSSITEAKDLSKKVSQLFVENKIQELFKTLRQYWPIPDNEIDVLEEKTIKALNVTDLRFGKREEVIKVKEETIKDIAIRETYLVKYQNTAIRLIFVYFKNEKGWIVNSFKWDDNFSLEFK